MPEEASQNPSEPSESSQSSDKKNRKARVNQIDVPRHSLHEALRIPQAICDNYAKAPTKPLNIAAALEMSPNSSGFRMLLGASAAYGLTEGSHTSELIVLSELGRRIVAPTEEDSELPALREALLRPRIIKQFLSKYNNSRIPIEKIARNVLEEMGVPSDATERTLSLIMKGAKEVGLVRELKGNLYGDIDGVEVTDAESEDDVSNGSDENLDDESSKIGKLKEFNQTPLTPPAAPMQNNNRVFITHGRNKDIVTQLKELLSFGKFTPVVAEDHETVSKPVPDKVLDEMRSCYAAIIHVGSELKLLDHEGKEHVFLNQNVLIEIGAAMALYQRRFILLVERGVTLPSNLQGLYEVRYEGDKLDYDATMKLLRAFNEFKE